MALALRHIVYTCTWIIPLGHITIQSLTFFMSCHSSSIHAGVGDEVGCVGNGVGVVGNSRCYFTTGNSVSKRGKEDLFESSSPFLLWRHGRGYRNRHGAVGRESMPPIRSFEKGEVRVFGSGGTAPQDEHRKSLLGGDNGTGAESVVRGDVSYLIEASKGERLAHLSLWQP
jgi:hypothetical protein